MINLKPINLIEVADFGQIGAGKIVDFIPKSKKRWIVPPQNVHHFQPFITYTVSGESLIGRGIKDGDILICRTRFEISEIKEDTVCVLLIHNSELTVKMVSFNDDGTVTIRSAHPNFPERIYFQDEIEIKALVCVTRFQNLKWKCRNFFTGISILNHC